MTLLRTRNALWRVFTVAILCALGLTLAAPEVVSAQYTGVGHRRPRRCSRCQQYQSSCHCEQGYSPSPTQPAAPNATDPAAADPMTDPMTDSTQPTDSATDNFVQQSFASPQQSVAQGANASIIGRADIGNRLNLFDAMNAIPMNRVWFGYQALNKFNNSVRSTGGGGNAAAVESSQRGFQVLGRAGFEYAVSNDFSIALQGQLHNTPSGSALAAEFDNPQVILKRVLYRDRNQTTSFVLGFEFQSGLKNNGIGDDTSRIMPGILSYHRLSDDWFFQWGVQGSIATEGDQVNSVDWVGSLGYWAYRHGSLNGCNRCYNANNTPTLVGLVTQLEILGRHGLGNLTVPAPPGFNGGSQAGFVFQEPGDVYDLTAGLSAVLKNGIWVNVGVSTAIGSEETRASEVTSTISYVF